MYLSPVKLVIKRFGTASAVADALGIRPVNITYWQERGKGRIPSKHQATLIAIAKQKHIRLTPAELVLGSDEG